ncbi:MAG: hypothetical protein XE03_1810 [candidate division TA06 bacterium 34_109]|uniref:Uncharacterized protein n=1 Tax=candidate division TA06 bacterium 34_109 TaxID=1635277 RepID=A0A124FZZ8_UNCT6|nr:MAG: hypothetical protein XE03_1810 [candidate division TA06 bacterium 34_109]
MYLFNYLKVKDVIASIYFRYGFPLKNNGFGICLPKIFGYNDFSFGLSSDLWTQYYYGKGFSLSSNIVYNLNNKISFSLQVGYKTSGYLVGKITEKGLTGNIGLKYTLF